MRFLRGCHGTVRDTNRQGRREGRCRPDVTRWERLPAAPAAEIVSGVSLDVALGGDDGDSGGDNSHSSGDDDARVSVHVRSHVLWQGRVQCRRQLHMRGGVRAAVVPQAVQLGAHGRLKVRILRVLLQRGPGEGPLQAVQVPRVRFLRGRCACCQQARKGAWEEGLD